MRRTPVEALITYASFFAISVAIHMVAILGGASGEPGAGSDAREAAAATAGADDPGDPRRAERP